MKKTVRKTIAILLSTAGVLLALYFGGYWLLFRPVRALCWAFTDGTLTLRLLVIAVIKIFFSTTVSGLIWVVFDIIAGYFRDDFPGEEPSDLPESPRRT